MDTPERNQIGTPLSKFEDSPVFSYISSLSPIKPFKSLHVTQTFNSLSFSSPPVYTSPHVTCHRESRFLRSHNTTDLSNPKEDKGSTKDDIADKTDVYRNGNKEHENTDQGVPLEDGSIESSKEDKDFPIELPNKLNCNFGSPDYEATPCSGVETSSLLELPSNSESLTVSVQQAKRSLSEDELEVVEISEVCCIEPKPDGTESDWDNLIASELLIFNSPNDTEAFKGLISRPLDPAARFCNVVLQLSQDEIKNVKNLHFTDQITSSQCETDYNSSNPVAAIKQVEGLPGHQIRDCANVATIHFNPNEKMNNEVVISIHFNTLRLLAIAYYLCIEVIIPSSADSGFIMQRGLRRRCLDFGMTSTWKMSADGSNSNNCICPSEKITINDKQIISLKQNADSKRCIVPGIGLHLNALAKTLKDYGDIKHEISQGSSSTIQPPVSQEHALSLLVSSERYTDPCDYENQFAENGSEQCEYLVTEDLNQNSPIKKRRKFETGEESEGCKRCNCKKSKCLKLYCECFAAGVYCIEPCTCQDCFNKPIHENTVRETRKQIESRNPIAFAPKVIRSSDSIHEIRDESNNTPASARHKRGCNCKRSNCLKKYCECYQGGVGCSINCRCDGCKNKFGRKDGSVPLGIEAETEGTETCEKSTADKVVKMKTDIQNIDEHMDSTLATTPSQLCRSLVPLSFSSRGNGKPPRACFVTIGSYCGHELRKPNVKFGKQMKTISEDEMPENLRGDDASSINCMKTSPNSKRVSSPHCNYPSPTRRSGRKLILQSIPSFPSLTPHH